eukprot:scaffold185618_cov67-Attheya_sp.AAC.4
MGSQSCSQYLIASLVAYHGPHQRLVSHPPTHWKKVEETSPLEDRILIVLICMPMGVMWLLREELQNASFNVQAPQCVTENIWTVCGPEF